MLLAEYCMLHFSGKNKYKRSLIMLSPSHFPPFKMLFKMGCEKQRSLWCATQHGSNNYLIRTN